MPVNETLSRFQYGDVLIVQPSGGDDDPEAKAMAGQRCTFIKYVPFTGHCVVQFDGKAKRMYFRPQDLARAKGDA